MVAPLYDTCKRALEATMPLERQVTAVESLAATHGFDEKLENGRAQLTICIYHRG